jgi:muramidase (phage lysozyme)
VAEILDRMLVQFGLDASEFVKKSNETLAALEKTRAKSEKTAKDMETRGKQAANFFANIRREVLGLIVATGALKTFSSGVAESTQRITAMSRAAANIDLPYQDLQQFQRILKTAGDSAETATGMLQRFKQMQNEVKAGRFDQASVTFMQDIGANDPNLTPNQMFEKFITFAQAHKGDEARVRLEGQQGGLTPNAITYALSHSLDQYRADQKEVDRDGYLNPGDVKNVSELSIAWSHFGDTLNQTWDRIDANVAPKMTAMLKWVRDMAIEYPKMAEAAIAAIGVVGTVGGIWAGIKLKNLFGGGASDPTADPKAEAATPETKAEPKLSSGPRVGAEAPTGGALDPADIPFERPSMLSGDGVGKGVIRGAAGWVARRVFGAYGGAAASLFIPSGSNNEARDLAAWKARQAGAVGGAGNNALLNLIGQSEGTDAGRGYNETFAYGKYGGHEADLTGMSLNQVLAVQQGMLDKEHASGMVSGSSAVGRYQIINKTLKGLMSQMGLTGNEKFDAAMQDRMALQLMTNGGPITPQSLAKIWASLPVDVAGHGNYAGQAARVNYQSVMQAINSAAKTSATNITFGNVNIYAQAKDAKELKDAFVGQSGNAIKTALANSAAH